MSTPKTKIAPFAQFRPLFAPFPGSLYKLRPAPRGLVLTALGLGTAAEDGFALLLTEEQPDGTLDFTLRFCEGWGETGDHYAEDSLSAVSASGTAQADGSFTARIWGQELSGEPFYGDHGGMSLTEEEGGVISFFSAGVGVIFRLDAQLRVASIERYEVA